MSDVQPGLTELVRLGGSAKLGPIRLRGESVIREYKPINGETRRSIPVHQLSCKTVRSKEHFDAVIAVVWTRIERRFHPGAPSRTPTIPASVPHLRRARRKWQVHDPHRVAPSANLQRLNDFK